nr:lasso peptide biosynthesis B2 protein [Mucilaginibacter sp. E4BP6]
MSRVFLLFCPYTNCLAISTAHWWLMKRRGIYVQLKFGMKKQNEKLAAHSWLEYNGIAFTKDMSINKNYIAFETAIL